MLNHLYQRRRELDVMNGMRKQSLWQGSIASASSGSISYSSPPQQIPQATNGYQQTPPQVQPTQHYLGNAGGRQMSPPSFYPKHASSFSQPQEYWNMPYSQPSQQYTQQSNVNFSEPAYQNTSAFGAAPSQQFAAWGGYGGPVVQDTLDEENAVPPEANPWDMT